MQRFENAVNRDGVKGLLLTPPFGQYRSNDRRVYPFYEVAESRGVTVQFHHSAQIVGNPALCQLKYARLDALQDVIVDFPRMKIVIEHLGFPWTEELLILMVSHANFYTDFAMMYGRPLMLAWNLVKAKEYGLMERILYGSDYWAPGQGIFSEKPENEFKGFIAFITEGLNQILAEQHWPTLSDEEIEGILWKNAARFYDLEV